MTIIKESHYELHLDPSGSVLMTVMKGFWAPELFAEFGAVHKRVLGSLAVPKGDHICLVDAREYEIQSQDLVPRMAAMLHDPAMKARKLAIVIPGALVKRQIGRLATLPWQRVFYTIEEARDWLEVSETNERRDLSNPGRAPG